MKTMGLGRNQTLVTEFVFVSFTTEPHLQVALFVIFLFSYILTLMGNLGLTALICLDLRLHTPMYFFVGSLSFLDTWYSSVYTPRILADCISKNKIMSYTGCVIQYFFSAAVVHTECFLLAAMAYDRSVAICNPLLYSSAMTKKLCIQLVASSYAVSFANAIAHTSNMFRLHFCGDNTINHFFCDALPLMKLACDDIRVYEIILAAIVGCNVGTAIGLVLCSYTAIVAAIVRIHSATGRHKAFSTCSAHLVSVTFFYGFHLFIYLRPSSQHTPEGDKVAALFYTVVNPLLNPVIYSLRNKDVKEALKKALSRTVDPR